MVAGIDKTAIVEKGAELGEDVSVGPYTVIRGDVKIGDRCEIGSCVLIEGNTEMGDGNRIFHGASIGTEPQDLKYLGEKTYLKIGSNNTIREFVTVNLATGEGDVTLIGDNCLLMAYVHIAHNCVVGNNVVLANSVNLAGHVTVHDYAIIGGLVPVHQFVSIGAHAFIGGGSRIPKDIPPFFKFAGNPPRVSGLNSVGLERRGFTIEQRTLLKKAYRYLYRSELNVTQAVEKIRSELEQTPEIVMLTDFICNSRRGLTR